MKGTAVSPTKEDFLEELETWKVSLLSCLEKARQQVQLVADLMREEVEGNKSTATGATAVVSPKDLIALNSLKETDEVFMKKVCGGIEGVARKYRLDLSHFFEVGLAGVGKIVRSFRGVTALDFQREFCKFINGKTNKNKDSLELFFKIGADVDGLVGGQNALMIAVVADSMEGLQMVVGDGADLEVRAESNREMLDPATPIYPSDDPDACRCGGEENENGTGDVCVNIGDTALMVACRLRRWGMVQFLVGEGANVEAEDAGGRKVLHIAYEAAKYDFDLYDQGMERLARKQLKQSDASLNDLDLQEESNALDEMHAAVIEALKVLIAKTTDLQSIRVGRMSWPLLHCFIARGFEELVTCVLEREVNVNAVDLKNNTALHIAALRGNSYVLPLLIERGAEADVNRQNSDGNTPLICAQVGSQPDGSVQKVSEILLDHGADPNIRGGEGRTALHWAVGEDLIETEQLLLERGADQEMRDLDGRTAHDFSNRNAACDFISLLGLLSFLFFCFIWYPYQAMRSRRNCYDY